MDWQSKFSSPGFDRGFRCFECFRDEIVSAGVNVAVVLGVLLVCIHEILSFGFFSRLLATSVFMEKLLSSHDRASPRLRLLFKVRVQACSGLHLEFLI